MKKITSKIISILRPPIEKWIVRTIITAGVLLITNGVQGFSWIVELVLHIIKIESENKYGVNYSIDSINWVSVIIGLFLITSGLLLHNWYKNSELKFQKSKKLFISIIHKSIDDFIKPEFSKIADLKIDDYLMQEIVIDQTMIYKNGNLEYPEASLLYQNDILSKITALSNNHNDFEIAYFGLAHIPLIWNLGATIVDKFHVNYYEYDRNSTSWKKMISSNNNYDNLLSSETISYNNESTNAILKIEISFDIANSEIFKVVDNQKYFHTIKLNSIGLDKITDLNQVQLLTKEFRNNVDKIIKNQKIENIHIFYSGPVSLALSLSRKISKRTDPNYIIYNYTRNTFPKYKWSIKITNNNSEILKY
jgi:hypothetical protein|tara:strand:+ start:585 stop:1676 length:1092 start_codon:yes stop_codon:yes gene_type:complete